MNCKAILVSCFLLVGCESSKQLDSATQQKIRLEPEIIHTMTLERQPNLLIDKHGRQIFTCINCPTKACTVSACTMTQDPETGVQKGECLCID